MDAFENFGEQEQSWSGIEENKQRLVDEAREIVSQYPHAQPTGVLFCAGAKFADAFQEGLEKLTGQPFRGPGFVGIMPREMLEDILRVVECRVDGGILAFFAVAGRARQKKSRGRCPFSNQAP